jgi:hypothetical protein
MLLWFLTLCTSVKPLLNMMTRILLSVAFLTIADKAKKQDTTTAAVPNDAADTTATTTAAFSAFTTTTVSPTELVMLEKSLITGIYNYESSENFQNYLKELGVSWVLRNLAGLATPVVTIAKDCPQTEDSDTQLDRDYMCDWTLRTDTLFKSHTVKFRLGENGTDVTMDGRSVEFVVEKTGPNQLVEVQKSGGKTTRLVRDFSEERMDVTLTINAVVSSSVFGRHNLMSADEWRKKR